MKPLTYTMNLNYIQHIVKMKNTFFLALLLAIGAFCFNGCGPDEKPVEDLGFFPLGEVKDYHYFQPGSWWVYKNMITGELDTVVMHRSKIDTIHVGNNIRRFSYEDITYTTTSINLRENYNHSRRYPMSAEPIDWKYFYYISRSRISEQRGFEGEQNVFLYPLNFSFDDQNAIHFQEKINDFFLQGNNYEDVLVYDLIRDASWKSKMAKYYWGKNVGLVKRERFDRETLEVLDSWELIEYEVAQ